MSRTCSHSQRQETGFAPYGGGCIPRGWLEG
jgi:hypothetical protein